MMSAIIVMTLKIITIPPGITLKFPIDAYEKRASNNNATMSESHQPVVYAPRSIAIEEMISNNPATPPDKSDAVLCAFR